MISQFRKEMMHASLNFRKEQETGKKSFMAVQEKASIKLDAQVIVQKEINSVLYDIPRDEIRVRRKLRWRWGTGVDGGTTSRAWCRCLPAATNSQERLGQFLHLNHLLIAPETLRTIQIQSVLFRVIAANRTVKANGNQVKADGTIKHHFYSVITCKTIYVGVFVFGF